MFYKILTYSFDPGPLKKAEKGKDLSPLFLRFLYIYMSGFSLVGGWGESLPHQPKFSEFPPPPSPNSPHTHTHKILFLPHKILISYVLLVDKGEKRKCRKTLSRDPNERVIFFSNFFKICPFSF